ncbi:hypothetical protein IEN85_10635 [Pelagicoccus sp. NFK12]|uniref:Uncharacterized protein n=1 Tax=Pelagicoccus enzymogenes TaxID=2773457 RepID=A0A927F8S7_9BACT|nr:hypothetical protein [Pelagicoccus enzymogenes]MBD5779944.1 hypothetical protein [Pelagicoccus enzymogenes]MDQ8200812.1 hypothetical protein [Pelagicoccus enzymogenes]
MSPHNDPDWEVVDELPGEKKPSSQPGRLVTFLKSKTLWIGLLAGAALVILVPVFRVMLQNLVRAWWIWVGLALYWIWRRMKKNAAAAQRRR